MSESCLREGEDYNSSDYEYDSDEEEDYDQLPPCGVNETLTKKKFYQSDWRQDHLAGKEQGLQPGHHYLGGDASSPSAGTRT